METSTVPGPHAHPVWYLGCTDKVVVQRKFEEWRNAENHQAEKLVLSSMKEFQ